MEERRRACQKVDKKLEEASRKFEEVYRPDRVCWLEELEQSKRKRKVLTF